MTEHRGSVTYLFLKDYSREKGENILLVMMTFSYLTVKWDTFPWPGPCQLLAPSLPARVHSTFTHSVSVLLQGDTSKRVPSEVSQSYLKLLLWYSFRVLSGEMDQSDSTLSFETRALAHVAVPSRQENTAARTEWLLSLEAKTFLQPTDWGSPHSTSAAFLRSSSGFSLIMLELGPVPKQAHLEV